MIVHEYESTFIIRPDVSDEEFARVRKRIEDAITNRGGQSMVYEDWGKRKLAYPIQKLDFGRYVFLHYVAGADAPAELERIVGIEFNVLRFLTVRTAVNVSFDAQLPLAIDRQKRRITRATTQADDDRRATPEERRRTRSAADRILSPGPVRFENADGQTGDLSDTIIQHHDYDDEPLDDDDDVEIDDD